MKGTVEPQYNELGYNKIRDIMGYFQISSVAPSGLQMTQYKEIPDIMNLLRVPANFVTLRFCRTATYFGTTFVSAEVALSIFFKLTNTSEKSKTDSQK